MPRIELHLDESLLNLLQERADAAGQSRKKYLESLCIKDAARPLAVTYFEPIPNPYHQIKPEAGQFIKYQKGYVFNYQDQDWYISDVIFSLDNFQYYFEGEAGSVEDSILL